MNRISLCLYLQQNSLNFVVKYFFMKLFQTTNIDIVRCNYCRQNLTLNYSALWLSKVYK